MTRKRTTAPRDDASMFVDARTKARHAVLAKMKRMSARELFQIAVRAGIYTPSGDLTAPYRTEPDA